MLKKPIAVATLLAMLFVSMASGQARRWQPRAYQEDKPHKSGAMGIMVLGVRMDNPASLADADGDYVSMLFSEHGSLYTAADQIHLDIDQLGATASWVAVGADTAALTTSTTHVSSHDVSTSLSLNKTGATVADASYKKTIAPVDASSLAGTGLVDFYVKTTDLSNISEVFIRIGTDSSNYDEYAIDPEDFSTADLVKEINHSDVLYIPERKKAVEFLQKELIAGDLLLLFTAGDAIEINVQLEQAFSNQGNI